MEDYAYRVTFTKNGKLTNIKYRSFIAAFCKLIGLSFKLKSGIISITEVCSMNQIVKVSI